MMNSTSQGLSPQPDLEFQAAIASAGDSCVCGALDSLVPGQGTEACLAGIARAYEASLAGICAQLGRSCLATFVVDRRPKGYHQGSEWPWSGRPEVMLRAELAPTAISIRTHDQEAYLLTAFELGGILWHAWLGVSDERSWTCAEQQSFSAIAMGLARRIATSPAASSWPKRVKLTSRQAKLEVAARSLRHLAHDVNNTFTNMLGFTELSLETIPRESTAYRFLGEALSATRQGIRVVEAYSQFTRRGTSRAASSVLATHLDYVIQQIPAKLKAAAQITAAVERELPPLRIDAEALRLILGHLITNALEALGGKGTVVVRARKRELHELECGLLLGSARPGAHAEIAIVDDGPGFSEDALHKVLDEAFCSTKPGRAGLGLAATYGILSSHGGGLSIEPGEAGGTNLTIYVPLVTPQVNHDGEPVLGKIPARPIAVP